MRRGMGLRLSDILTGGSAAAPKSTLVNDLVSYWSLDEESGTRVDSVGSADLTDNNTVLYDTGVNGNAASFVGINAEELTLDDTDSVQPGSSGMTWAFWLKAGAAAYQYWMSKGIGANQFAPLFGCQTGGAVDFYIGDGSGTSQAQLAAVSGLDDWTLIIAWWDGTEKKANVWVKNAAEDRGIAGIALSGQPYNGTSTFTLGSATAGGGFATGLMDEVAIWSRVLTEDERTELYNSGAGKFYNSTSEDFE